jgi:hypothetical protein
LGPGLSYQSRQPAAADLLASPLQGDPHAPVALGAVVGLLDLGDQLEQALVGKRSG